MSSPQADDVTGNSDESGQEFMVEKILAMRRRHGKRQFKIRWKGYGPEEDTWEPEENCDCTELIEEFMQESVAKKRAASAKSRGGKQPRHHQQHQQPQSPSATESVGSEAAPSVGALFNEEPALPTGPEGFDRGLEPEKVVGAAKLDGKLHLLVRWRDSSSQSSEAELVPAAEANIRCPQLVIQFYESSLAWCPDDDEDAIV